MTSILGKIKEFLEKWERPSPERLNAEVDTRALSQPDGTLSQEGQNNLSTERQLRHGEDCCPYCNSKKFVRRGKRKKKLEVVQLYICKNSECGRTFTAQFIKGKHYPMNLIIEGLSYYNLGFGLEDTCRLLNQKFGRPSACPVGSRSDSFGAEIASRVLSQPDITPSPSTLAGWVKQYSSLCRYERLRPFATKMYKPQDTVEVTTMAHRQIYRFRYHRAKMRLTLQEFKNRDFEPLKDYLDGVSAETPHQYFQEGLRISEIKTKFNKAQMIVRAKNNYANRLADFVLQAVKDNKMRHEALQRFLIANDSVTVASEVPVYIRKEDIEHMENVLKFKILRPDAEIDAPLRNTSGTLSQKSDAYIEIKGKKTLKFPKLLTGHIDLLQVRNGLIHILDYKPNAANEKPIEQLTWYALALSRLTGLRLYEFKCAWFDEKDYFEFYPLHVVKKLKVKYKRRARLKGVGTVEIPDEDKITVA